jgi:hypothetical protein
MSVETVSGLAPPPGAPEAATAFRRRRTRLAWLLLWLGFLGFLVLCVGAALGVFAFATGADVARTATLVRAHRTQLEIQRAGQREWTLFPSDAREVILNEGDAVRTGPDTDALIELFDNSTLQLYYSSEVELTTLRTSRFFDRKKTVVVEQRRGVVNYSIAPPAPNLTGDLQVTSGEGADQVRATLPDSAIVRVSIVGADRTTVPYTQVTVVKGEPVVALSGSYARPVPGQMVRAFAGGTLRSPEETLEELFVNGALVAPPEDPTEVVQGWKIVPNPNTTIDPPQAITHTEALAAAEVRSVELTRATGQEGPQQIVMQQDLGGQQVGFYRTLTLQAQVKVVAQPPETGPNGPFPLSLRLHYYDQEGLERTWIQVFYYDDSDGAAARVDPTGALVRKGAWQERTYDLKQLAPDMVRLGWFEVVGEGTEFSVWVSGLSLVGQ